MDIRSALKLGIRQLREAQVPSHTLAAELLLMHALGRDRAWIYAHPEEEIAADAAERYLSLIARRAKGEPTQYLTGKQEFWGLAFEVTPDVLIPRSETEHLVEVALDRLALRELRAGRAQKTLGDGVQIADVGTGSGCLAVALARELPFASIHATDISAAALDVARRNAQRHSVADRIHFIECNLLDGLSSSSVARRSPLLFDLIVSNPPYVGRQGAEELPREVREHEPKAALFGGEEGYELYAALVAQAASCLKPGGLLVLELGYNCLPAVQPLLEGAEWTNAGVTKDLAGIPRVIAAERTGGGL
ncbi:MAG TPA: peptide chain release factor N(5)-glutamine methyltransferase [Candidatus Acidoferrales bacterium]|nr:peptide chain release factor N(5)-glutamine methyltransferase [Candidatus Acidoferrales bacterium]